jgi:glycosyltransferase involved in cell wall biosynthesis
VCHLQKRLYAFDHLLKIRKAGKTAFVEGGKNPRKMKITIITTDNREPSRQYQKAEPFFGTAPEALLQGFAGLSGVEVHVVSCIREPVQSPAKLADNIFFHSLTVPKIGWMKTLFQGCIRAVRKKIEEIQPDIVHGQGTEMDCSLGAIFSGFPNVVTIHGNMRAIARINRAKPFSYVWLAAWLESFTLPRTDGVVCITNYTRDAVKSLARRTWLLPNAVDQSFFEVAVSPNPAKAPTGLCVGTICFHKNQNDFIRALDQLAREKDFQIVFLGQVGKDAYGAEFLRLVEERPWCKFVGWAGRDQLKDYLRSASFLVLPTREDNCPMVVLEAMAAGLPVLASNVGGVPDLIQPETTGLFCDPLKPESFSTGVGRLLEDAALSRRLASAAKAEARARFHPEVIARGHMKIYREVLGFKDPPI